MRKFYITKDKDGFKYSENVYMGWSRCPDRVHDRASLLKFLTSDGRYDKPAITFSDNSGRPAKLYEVTRHNGSILAVVDGKDQMPLIRQHFMSDDEAADWFKTNECSDIVKNEADSKATAKDRLKHYQENATELTRDEFKKLCSEKLNNDSIKSYLEKQAAIDGMGAEVLFK
jgi:hypothetical protein